MHLPKIDTSNLWDKTYSILKECILRRQYGPNHKLSIPELSKQLGVSRTPLRDALNRLEMEGLVKTIAKVGTFVVAITEQDVRDFMDTRLMLEFWTVEKLNHIDANMRNTTIQGMRNILSASANGLQSGQLTDYLEADYNMEFHLEFMRLGQNSNNLDVYLRTMNYRYITMKSSIISNDMVSDAIQQHQSIIDAIVEGNIQDIKQVIQLHLEDSQTKLLEKIRKNGGSI